METFGVDRYRWRFMNNKQTEWGTVAGMTALLGVLPLLITLGIAQSVPAFSALVLAIIHVALMGVGAWIFSAWFGD